MKNTLESFVTYQKKELADHVSSGVIFIPIKDANRSNSELLDVLNINHLLPHQIASGTVVFKLISKGLYAAFANIYVPRPSRCNSKIIFQYAHRDSFFSCLKETIKFAQDFNGEIHMDSHSLGGIPDDEFEEKMLQAVNEVKAKKYSFTIWTQRPTIF